MNTNVTDLAEAMKIAGEFKKAVNDRYKLLEIDVDGIFQRLLLLQKKKYAAVKIEATDTSVEVKGLDMKRREYCALSKAVSQYVLEQILSGEVTETVVENIHEYLSTMSDEVRNGKVKLEEFIIFKASSLYFWASYSILIWYYSAWVKTLKTIPTPRASHTYK